LSKVLKRPSLSNTPYYIQPPLPSEPPAAAVEPSQRERPEEKEAKRILASAKEKAQAMIGEAQKLREEISAKAQAEGFEKGLVQGREEGFQKGLVQGREEGLRQAQEIIAQAKTILNSALAGQEELARQLEHQLAKLALAIAEKIVGELAQEKEELVLHVAKRAMEKVRGESQVTIRVNLEDLRLLQAERAALLAGADGIKTVNIVEDPRVERGGCVIETNLGTIDARLKTQLSELAKLTEEGKSPDQTQPQRLSGQAGAD
jgi:flagellar assembly protein FliH